MPFTKQKLDSIYQRSTGYCHLCHKKLSRKNYNTPGARGAWHVEHSKPRSKGGTDHMNNLFAACIDCNADKSNYTTRTARGWNGKSRAPLSPERRDQVKTNNGILCALGGRAVGFAVAGPVGALIGALTGGHLGASGNPDRQ
jgi:5-methylcytosine-specific restriction endonuclease McrA